MLQIKFKALTMEEKDVDLWWDVLQDISRKILKTSKKCMKEMRSFTCIRYLGWKKSYHHFSMNL
jgi:hypothetical protein